MKYEFIRSLESVLQTAASAALLARGRPVRFGGKCSPPKGRCVVDQSPGSASDHRPGVISAVEQRPGP